MKLEVSIFRYLEKDDFRVLTSIEMGLKNHEFVPTQLIEQISNLRRGGCRKVLSRLLKHKLVAHDGKKFDGYKLTYNGYDFLALKAFISRGHISDVGIRMGVGKEADIHVAWSPSGKKLALKLHRLGRLSFRSIKNNRDYLQHRKSASWMYMSRLAATKEFAYNKALYDAGFKVPFAVDHNRHCILMEFVEAYPLYQLKALRNPGRVMELLFKLVYKLGRAGLIHGDLNEFNLMIGAGKTKLNDDGTPMLDRNGNPAATDPEITLIDFPQIVMINHQNGDYYFNRDVNCIRTFFRKRFGIIAEDYPQYQDVIDAIKDQEERAKEEEVITEELELEVITEELELEGSENDEAEDENVDSDMKARDDCVRQGEASEAKESTIPMESEKPGEKKPTKKKVSFRTASVKKISLPNIEGMELLEGLLTKDEAKEEGGEDEDPTDQDSSGDEDEAGQKNHSEDEEEEDQYQQDVDEEEDEFEDDNSDNEYMKHDRIDSNVRTNFRPSKSKTSLLAPTEEGVSEITSFLNSTSIEEDESDRDHNSSHRRNSDTDLIDGNKTDIEEDDFVEKIPDQIHVIQRQKRKRLTPEEIREKMKRKEKQSRTKNCNKLKTNRKMKDEVKATCKDFGY